MNREKFEKKKHIGELRLSLNRVEWERGKKWELGIGCVKKRTAKIIGKGGGGEQNVGEMG